MKKFSLFALIALFAIFGLISCSNPAGGGNDSDGSSNVTVTINNLSPGDYKILMMLEEQDAMKALTTSVTVDVSGTATAFIPYSTLNSLGWGGKQCYIVYAPAEASMLWEYNLTKITYLCEKGAHFILDAITDFN